MIYTCTYSVMRRLQLIVSGTLAKRRSPGTCDKTKKQNKFTIYNLQFTIYNLQFTIYNLQFTIYNLQFTIYNLQFTIYNLWYFSLQRVLSFPSDFPINHYAIIPAFTTLPTIISYQQKIKITNNLLKVTIVRHPFVRITSTYQDKVIDNYGKRGNFQTELIKFTSILV
jgi:hypothetical protein